jgi:hypothetical protein
VWESLGILIDKLITRPIKNESEESDSIIHGEYPGSGIKVRLGGIINASVVCPLARSIVLRNLYNDSQLSSGPARNDFSFRKVECFCYFI